ncbi:hypothetical protein GPECTOR_3g204 [Gonium pectorale]|uniref:DNA/pantothenate metabolism flavoprotein C-terminal domain-containing protein n=1 Tax=Gonium pectorale TaxID=33097 RepID=A0A150GZ19_GONPE|nr:hypothetical protein GPECTOR_3g204 [Gonium pectorale]|eukprot:KXZ55045.1 hypothetical protein GPECTOR_3g204 [Gonium pectorale]
MRPQAGYAVIFLTRTGSLQPFAHLLPSCDPPELVDRIACLSSGPASDPDCEITSCSSSQAHGSPGDEAAGTGAASAEAVGVRPEHAAAVARVLRARRACREADTLLTIKYESIFEYLTPLGSRVVFYLAAAVSDFYVPWSKLVPKMLGVLVHEWAPKAFVVSFKLETDQRILVYKASTALQRYGVHLVVANLLHNRKDVVTLVEPARAAAAGRDGASAQGQSAAETVLTGGGGGPIGTKGYGAEAADGGAAVALNVVELRRPNDEPDIERLLVGEVATRHRAFQARSTGV